MNEQNENITEPQAPEQGAAPEQGSAPEKGVSPENVEFAEIEPGLKGDESSQSIDFLLDIPLEITVELGRTRIQIGDLLKLGQGSVVELEKLTNEPVDIYINQKLMGHGEVVVVNEKFAIRLTNIISPGERVQKLK